PPRGPAAPARARPRDGRGGVADRLRRLLDEPLATERARDVRGDRPELLVRAGVAAKTREYRLDGAGLRAQRVLVQPLGELEREACVISVRPEAIRPCEAAVDHR